MNSLEEAIQEMAQINVIIAGDFNYILNPALDKSSPAPMPAATEDHRTRIRTFVEENLLCDVWRDRFPAKPNYTFRRGSYASRLDFFLLSTHLSEGVSSMSTQVSAQSDHSLLLLQFNNPTQAKGKGLWRFNTALLNNNDFIIQMSEFLSDWVPPPELENPCAIWDWLKHEIKVFVTAFSRRNYSREKQRIKNLSEELQDLIYRADRGEPTEDQIAAIRWELKQLEDIQANKLIFRSRCRWA